MFNRIMLCMTALFIAGCANVKPRTGGAQDKTPPEVVSQSPENLSTNFPFINSHTKASNNSFSIEFNEWIQLKDINNQLLVSPPLENKPTVRIKKKTVSVSWDEKLKENTTYTFNFGQGVVDYTEGNAARGLSYVFSTGPQLDSSIVEGKVINAYTNDPLENIRVMFYKDTADSVVFKEKPYYLGLTNSSGEFSIPFVAEGKYKYVALKDDNLNYLYDDQEAFAYGEYVLVEDSLTDAGTLRLSTGSPSNQFIEDYSRDSTGFVRMKLNMAEPPVEFEVLGYPDALYHFEERDDSIYFWLQKPLVNGDFDLRVSSNMFSDTLPLMSYPVPPREGILELKATGRGSISSSDSLKLSSNYFLATIKDSVCTLAKDSVPIEFDLFAGKSVLELVLDADFEDGSKYNFYCDPGAIGSKEGHTSDTLEFNFTTHNESHYSKLYLAIQNLDSLEGPLLFQLENKSSDIIVHFAMDSYEVNLDRMLPDSYIARIIADENNNGRWDPVDYQAGRQPEKVYYFPKEISLRSNWEVEYEWVISDLQPSEKK